VISLEPSYEDALQGIAVGDELVVLTWLHEADRGVLQVHPRGDETRPLTGVFATRSSDRPNPIGLHRVTVLGLDGLELTVGPLEAIDGTPVVDLKPVLRRRPRPRSARGGADDLETAEGESAAPIAHDYELGCSPERAFDLYAGRIDEWWDPRYTANADSFESVAIEPGLGGRVYATHADIGVHDWGEVTVWEPGRRLAHTFTLAQNPAHPSDVAIEFVPREGGCVVHFVHGGWTEANAGGREKFADWRIMLDRFAALADQHS
jgi:tRNA-Thr(GGU) m(6)t(6)A37 methyltransferase TsaA